MAAAIALSAVAATAGAAAGVAVAAAAGASKVSLSELERVNSIASTPLAMHTGHGKRLEFFNKETPFLHKASKGSALFAEDGSVIRKGPGRPIPPLTGPLPQGLPYLINGTGTPYGMDHQGKLWPLVLTPQGQPLIWHGDSIILAQNNPDYGDARPMVFPDGSPACLSSDGAPLGVIPLEPREGLAAGACIASAYVTLPKEELLLGPDGEPALLNPGTLDVMASNGDHMCDERGEQLWAGPAGRPLLHLMKSLGRPGAMNAAPEAVQRLSVQLVAGAVQLLVLVIGGLGAASLHS